MRQMEKMALKLNVQQIIAVILVRLMPLRQMPQVILVLVSVKIPLIVIGFELILPIPILLIPTPPLVPLKVLPQAPRLD